MAKPTPQVRRVGAEPARLRTYRPQRPHRWRRASKARRVVPADVRTTVPNSARIMSASFLLCRAMAQFRWPAPRGLAGPRRPPALPAVPESGRRGVFSRSRKRRSPRMAPRMVREGSTTPGTLVRENARRAKCISQAKAQRCVFNVLVERGAARNCRGAAAAAKNCREPDLSRYFSSARIASF